MSTPNQKTSTLSISKFNAMPPLISASRIITLDLLRKRSEHNEGLISSLEELALHQEELQAIGPILGRTCGRTLKILLLQNNVIGRMDPSELKLCRSLEYLNLALNNVTKVEGVGGMEVSTVNELNEMLVGLICKRLYSLTFTVAAQAGPDAEFHQC